MGAVEKSSVADLDSLAQQINEEHRAFIGSLRKTAEHGIRAGELLTQAKAQCKHGTWLAWLAANFEGSERTAQTYMRLYNNREELRAKTQHAADLSVRGALRELAAPDAEEEAEEQGMSRAELEAAEARILELLAKADEHMQQALEGFAQLRQAIKGMFRDGYKTEGRVWLREGAVQQFGLAWGVYNFTVMGAREQLAESLEVLASANNSGAAALRERVLERLRRLDFLAPEEAGLLESLYPGELSRIRKDEAAIALFGSMVEDLDQHVRPVDVVGMEPSGLKSKELTEEQRHTPFGELLRTEVLTDPEAYRLERWVEPLLVPFEDHHAEAWLQPDEWRKLWKLAA